MNYGQFIGITYFKKVSFAKAVLWYARQLSLPELTIMKIETWGIKKLIFIDMGKHEYWTFKAQKVLENMELKQIGQEKQYYFPIDLCRKHKFVKLEDIKIK